MSTFETDIWARAYQKTKAAQKGVGDGVSRESSSHSDDKVVTGGGVARTHSHGSVDSHASTAVSERSDSDSHGHHHHPGVGHNNSHPNLLSLHNATGPATLRNSLGSSVPIFIKHEIGGSRKEESILYRIFHPGTSHPHTSHSPDDAGNHLHQAQHSHNPFAAVFARSRRTYNSGSESEFDSEDPHSDVDSNHSDAHSYQSRSSLSIKKTTSNVSVRSTTSTGVHNLLGSSSGNCGGVAIPSSSGTASSGRDPHNSNSLLSSSASSQKSMTRSSIPRITSGKELSSLFDTRSKKKKGTNVVDSESESEVEHETRKASRPSIFKELLTHKPHPPSTSVMAPPKKMLSTNSVPLSVPSMNRQAASRSASDDSSDNVSDSDHALSHTNNIFKNIMQSKRRGTASNVTASKFHSNSMHAAIPSSRPASGNNLTQKTPSISPSTPSISAAKNSGGVKSISGSPLSTSPIMVSAQMAAVSLVGSPQMTSPTNMPVSQGGDLGRTGSESSLSEKYGAGAHDKVIGKGASAVVRMCSPVNSDKKYAIKEFRPRRKDEKQKEYVKKLIAEFCISSTLEHENVIKTVDLIQDDKKKWCVVMEYAEGGDLYTKIHTGLLTDVEVIDCFFKQLLRGVAYLHSMGVAHRDLKPENLLLDGSARVLKITDFGVSEVFRAPFESMSKKAHGMCGSGPYIAPEEFVQKEYDSEMVDIWACGIIYYVMLYNSIPWKSATHTDTRYKHYQEHRGNFWPIDRLVPPKRKLMYKILDPDVTKRAPMSDIMEDEWIKGISFCQLGTPVEAVGHSHRSLLEKPTSQYH